MYSMRQACQINADSSRSWHKHKLKTLVPTSLISQQRRRRLRSISAMKVEEVLFMKGGDGSESYAHNSSLQNWIIEQSKPIIQRALKDMCGSMLPSDTHFAMVDLGCSSGPNTLTTLSIILDTLESSCREMNHSMPQVKAFFNDLPGTDFNTLFRLLDSQQKLNKEEKKGRDPSSLCFVSGTLGSFYERLFPDEFLHFAHSSTALHFLSQVPKDLVDSNGDSLNKENICITERSSPHVHKAYHKQFKNDFTMFLRCRSKELVEGGRMVLTFRGSYKSEKPELSWDIQFLGLALNILALQGAIEKKKLDAFNMPFYTPTINEVRTIIEMEGSFEIERVETILTDWASSSLAGDEDVLARARFVEREVRAFIQPILASEFGDPIMDDMFAIFSNMVAENLSRVRKLELLSLVISLKKISQKL